MATKKLQIIGSLIKQTKNTDEFASILYLDHKPHAKIITLEDDD